ncbi:uncharacterized protein PGTG_12973 [Puccinia graminis f. sp. tritici CRL 75-36-700-3]|uniref:Uncharacterized protein n=1 Tax=Puccinia graminis f. sp. tritici (strain CRL 75-36-700-3 / race SCCL) TaxID=418459 RepID=E3KQL6_PUCGT|nr:uncharacterized protein PGTG_12973 [Puccinia graminis f. sp. tritici CRL 75-36-700-3]EFP86591.1 hypothetical protein PGTG_12973 [Puccinia graminis f. sp. tritici CRL 75-36-700-3]
MMKCTPFIVALIVWVTGLIANCLGNGYAPCVPSTAWKHESVMASGHENLEQLERMHGATTKLTIPARTPIPRRLAYRLGPWEVTFQWAIDANQCWIQNRSGSAIDYMLCDPERRHFLYYHSLQPGLPQLIDIPTDLAQGLLFLAIADPV